jgi:hypothetical protein
VVRRGYEALVDSQDADGRFDADPGAQALATLALTELCAATETVRFREPAQVAVDALLAMRTPGRGWMRAGVPDAGATAWGVLAVRSAELAGLAMPEGLPAGLLEDVALFGDPGGTQVSDRAGSLLTLALLHLGRPAFDEAVVSGLRRIVARPLAVGEPVDPVRAWAGTAAVFQAGGKDVWKRWDRALDAALIEPIGADWPLTKHGPSDVLGETGAEVGRVRSVVFTYLSACIHYRYGRVFGVTRR